MRGQGPVAALLGALWLAPLAGCGADESAAAEAGPLITIADEWNAVPEAEVVGELTLRDGRLLIGESVAFWLKGTTWDAEATSVVLVDGTSVAVGERFRGGGGHFAPGTDFDELLGSSEAAKRVAGCVDRTGAQEVVVAYA